MHDNFFELGGHSLLATQVRLARPRRASAWSCRCASSSRRPPWRSWPRASRPCWDTATGRSAPPLAPVPRDGARCRCPSRSSGCGSSTSSSPGSPPTTCPRRCAWRARWTRRALERSLDRARARGTRSLRTTFRAERRASPCRSSTAGAAAAGARWTCARCRRPSARRRPAGWLEEEARRALRPRARARCCARCCCGWREREHVLLLDDAPHHLRRLVHGRARARAGGALRGVRRGPALAAARAAAPVRGLRGLAARAGSRARSWRRSSPTGASSSTGAPPCWSCPRTGRAPRCSRTAGAHAAAAACPRRSSQALEALGQREGATLFMVLLAGFQALLRATPARTDIVVGTPIAGRTHAEIEGLIGFFVNTLVLRTTSRGDPTVPRAAGARARDGARARTPTRTCPSSSWCDALQPERSLSHTPLFQVMFVLQNVPCRELRAAGADASERWSATRARRSSTSRWRGGARRGLVRRAASTAPTCSTRDTVDAHARAPAACCWRRRSPSRSTRLSALPLLTEAERQQRAGGVERHAEPPYRATPASTTLFEAQVRAHAGRAWPSASRAPALTYARARRARQPAGAPPARARRRARGRASACASSARWRWSSACSASSRPAAPTSRWTRLPAASAWP